MRFALSDVCSLVGYGCYTSTDDADPSVDRRKMMSALSQDWPNQGVWLSWRREELSVIERE